MRKEIIERIAELWELVPDLRFGQLIENFINDGDGDFYYIENIDILNTIKDKIQEIRAKQEDRKIEKLLQNEITRDRVLKILRDNGLI